jgi:hypothetical protein
MVNADAKPLFASKNTAPEFREHFLFHMYLFMFLFVICNRRVLVGIFVSKS